MSKHEHRIALKRAYEEADANDGTRVLVDRLWPRGLSKERARVDAWLKEVAPSDALRRRFHGDPAGWKTSRPPITQNSNGSRRSRQFATCSIG